MLGDNCQYSNDSRYFGPVPEDNITGKKVLPEKLVLDEMQDIYNHLYNNWNNYKEYDESNFLPQKIELLLQQMVRQEQNHKEVDLFEQNISDNIRILKNQFKNWRENYLFTSPIKGTVALTAFWSENHVVNAGERLATVVPTDSSVIICRAIVPSAGSGKVEIGQHVNLKLSGYPYMEHGMLAGEISTVSLVPEKEGYLVEIRLNEGMKSSYSEQLKLVQEMDGTAEIIADEMRIIYRFINPLKQFCIKTKKPWL